jgi:hypothetical protein
MHLGWSPSACKAFGPFCSVEPVATCGILFAISPCEPCHIARPGAIHVDPGVAVNAVLTALRPILAVLLGLLAAGLIIYATWLAFKPI